MSTDLHYLEDAGQKTTSLLIWIVVSKKPLRMQNHTTLMHSSLSVVVA